MIAKYLSELWTAVAPAVGNHLWQSTVFAGVAGLLTLAVAEESCAGAVLGVAGGVGEIFGSVFVAGGNWELAWMGTRACEKFGWDLFCDGAG